MVIKLWLPLWVFVLFSCKGYGLGTAEIIFVRGKVEICSASMQFVQVAKKGDSISAKQGIRTYVDGLLILQLEDSSIIKIDPNSVILVETLIKKDHNKLKGHFGLQINAGAVIIHARKSNYPRIDRNQPLFEVRYLDTVIELNKGKLLAGVDLTNNNLWVSVKEGQAKIINFVWGKYVDLKFGYSVWVELGQLLSMPGKYAWPLRLNWQMNPEKNAAVGILKLAFPSSNEAGKIVLARERIITLTIQYETKRTSNFLSIILSPPQILNANFRIEVMCVFVKSIGIISRWGS